VVEPTAGPSGCRRKNVDKPWHGTSTSVPDDNPFGTTAANDSVSPSLTLLVSSLTRKEELVGYYNKTCAACA